MDHHYNRIEIRPDFHEVDVRGVSKIGYDTLLASLDRDRRSLVDGTLTQQLIGKRGIEGQALLTEWKATK